MSTTRTTLIAILSVLGLLIGLSACNRLVPRKGWSKANGPVVPHDTFPADCALCHVSGSWHTLREDFQFDHEAKTGVPLRGAHAQAPCLLCHNDRGPAKVFAARGCAGCHEDQHRGRMGARCEDCHTEDSWRPVEQISQHNRTRFPLVGAHAAAACFTCHPGATVGNFAGASTACEDCHQKDLARATSPDHRAMNLTNACQRCHVPFTWQNATFEHPAAFPLSGGHAGIQCAQCHTTPGVYTGLSTDCVSCHLPDYQRTAEPNHAAANFGTNCTQCHNTSRWQGAVFLHSAAFPLTNGHAGRRCSECHTTPGTYAGLSTDCASCHTDDYQRTTNPNHAAANFPTNCTQCHNTTRWHGASFQHPASFPLTAGHAGRSCGACHTTPGVYTGLSTDCASCHMADYQRTTNPNHATSGFPTNCTQCHNTTRWQGASFQHPTSFPLTNGHAGLGCTICHTTPGVFTGLSTDCASCHLPDYQHTTNPVHAAPAFPTNCKQCHNTTRWQGATFNHSPAFPLTNGHAGRTCSQCHTTPGVYTGLSTDCASCHMADYQRTTDPNHAASGFPTACTQCHNTTRWQGASFRHPASFPLTNGHAGVGCTRCHTTPGVYTGLSTACVSCHLQDYQRTTNPVHGSPGFSTDCTQCHNTTQWLGATFSHTPSFPLTNGHAGRQCSQCHTVPGVYTGLSTDCVSCHLADYQHTTNPNHAAASYPTTCTQCHNTTRWQGATFQHPASFPLTNGHANRGCTLCHTVPGVYTGLSTACVSCHLTNYQTTTNPVHTAPTFPTNCTQCHNTIQWQGATFNHTPAFPLTNGHAGHACAQCHTTPGVYTGLNSACVSCHLADYQHTTNPNHTTSGFGTGCATCHGTSTWLGAVFNHSFPITSGAHRGMACNQCHLDPTNQTIFTCTACHTHSQSSMASAHRDVRNYVWNSQNCYNCHPNGRH